METFRARAIDKVSDVELVAAAKDGDTQVFEELVSRHEQRVLAVAHRITKNREDAEDVAQESFHKAFLHLDAFEEKSQFSTWLTRIAMNEALMVLRKRRGVLEVLPDGPDDSGKSVSEVFVDRSPTPEESCWRRERSDLLSKAINRLSPKIRRTMFLRNIEERTIEETADILGTSIGVVKSRLFHGRRRLRRTLNPGLVREFCEAGRAEA
jgi:RNA polymerase sigma-70 factor (ECF subfamily)